MNSQNFGQSELTIRSQKLPDQLQKMYTKKQLLAKPVYRKSIFNPAPNLAEDYASRKHIPTAESPSITIRHLSHRWLLLQAPKLNTNFFFCLNLGRLGNIYTALLKVLNYFNALAQIYGYFRPSQQMIFLEKNQIKVWINEDIFSNQPAMPLSIKKGQQQFVVAFLILIETFVNDWQTTSAKSVNQLKQILNNRGRLSRLSCQTDQPQEKLFSQQKSYRPSYNEKDFRKIKHHKSFQKIKVHYQQNGAENISKYDTVDDFTEQNLSQHTFKSIQTSGQDKKLILDSKKNRIDITLTSTILSYFYQKSRNETQENKKIVDSKQQTFKINCPKKSLIAKELNNLFSSKGKQLFEEDSNVNLQKIAQQMDEVLI